LKKTIISFLIVISGAFAQEFNSGDDTGIFYFDSVVFNSDSSGYARMDIFSIIPYQSLTFLKSGDFFGSEYEINFKITDKDGTKVNSKTINRTIKEKEYFKVQGGNGECDHNQTIFYLPEGRYNVEVILFDKAGNKSYKRTRIQTVLNFNAYNFSLSGLLLLSSIEENEGKYIITPHVSDNVGTLSEFFYVFFETYKYYSDLNEADFVYQIFNEQNLVAYQSEKVRLKIGDSTMQHYLRVNIPQTLTQGTYLFRLFSLGANEKPEFDNSDIIASSERTIKYFKYFGNSVIQNIDLSIKQLRYAATQTEINYIESGANQQDKMVRFEEFWRKKDPSPTTDRNEAYDEYYSRITFANQAYRTYTEGWLTDMGMVYIIYGQPLSITKSNRNLDGRIYEKWTYNGRQFIFVDYNGLGDYRLYSPMSVPDKYTYEK
jgi:GWxTD domain-containing protein